MDSRWGVVRVSRVAVIPSEQQGSVQVPSRGSASHAQADIWSTSSLTYGLDGPAKEKAGHNG